MLGKAKVMSYDDLVAARATRSEKEAAKERVKKKNRWGREFDSQDSKILDCVVKTAHYGEADTTVGALSDGAQINENEVQPVPFQAPVARMY